MLFFVIPAKAGIQSLLRTPIQRGISEQTAGIYQLAAVHQMADRVHSKMLNGQE